MAQSKLTVTVELSESANRTLTLLVQGMFLLTMGDPAMEEYRQQLFEAAYVSGHLALPEQEDLTP